MKLFTQIKVGPLTLKNRVVMPAMHLGYTPDGQVNDKLTDFYVERAAGGVGLIIVGGCPIDDISGLPGMVMLRDDSFIPGLTRLTRAIHDHGALTAAQLYQAGRYAHSFTIGGKQPISASPVRSKFTGEVPREMTREDITWVTNSFAQAARRARQAGFDAVEILASAGYLISQFLSPLTNQRTDEYGGSFENRMRFGLEVADAVREAAGPDLAVLVRLAGNDFMPGSLGNAESAQFAAALETRGVDCFNITGGWHETRVPQLPMNLPRGGYVYLAQGIKAATRLPVMACNRINSPELAERILREGRADLVGVARGLIADPEWPNKALENRQEQITHCIACNQGCFDHVFTLQPVGCLVNPRAGLEASTRITPAESAKKIMVIGGGPAGLTFARVAALRGHHVALYEKDEQVGGQIHLASALRERAEFMTMIKDIETQAREAGVLVVCGREVDQRFIDREKPDVVVVATGGKPLPAPFPGSDLGHAVQAWDVLGDRVKTGRDVVIIGGGAVGCETALHLAAVGALTPEELHFLFLNQAETPETLFRLASRGYKNITMVEMTGRIGSDIGQTTGWVIRQDIKRAEINLMTKTKALEITRDGVLVEKGDEKANLKADTVVMAIGTQADTALYEAIKDRHPHVLLIGDAQKPAKAYEAVHSAFAAALTV